MPSRDFESAADERAYRLKTASPEIVTALRENEQEGEKAISDIVERQAKEFQSKFEAERAKLYLEKNIPKLVPPWSVMRRTQKETDRQAEINVKAKDQDELEKKQAVFLEKADRIIGLKPARTNEIKPAETTRDDGIEYHSAVDEMEKQDAKALADQNRPNEPFVKVWTPEQIEYFKEIEAERIAERFNEKAEDNTL